MPVATRHITPADSSAAVDAFMAALGHPQKALVASLRSTVMGADRRIAEGIKWNAPSFRLQEYFATVNLREKMGVGLILHLGAKVSASATSGIAVDDPAGLLRWLAPDRALLRFADQAEFEARRGDFIELLRRWIEWVR
jgi:hypothetical protein